LNACDTERKVDIIQELVIARDDVPEFGLSDNTFLITDFHMLPYIFV